MATLPNQLPKLAADPAGRSIGLDLPPGALLDTTVEGPWDEPLLWLADGPAAPGDWLRLAPARRTAGLYPVLVGGGGAGDGDPHPDKWGLDPELASYPGDHDADEVLGELWEEYATREQDTDWPGLAPAGAPDADPDVRAAEVTDALTGGAGPLEGLRLALVPARRSADIPAAIGWCGPAGLTDDVAELCAVLRSWEDRFGARVVALAADRLVVSVAAPPRTPADAAATAAEHYAFCPDVMTEGGHASLRAYAEREVLGAHSWTFRWD